MPLAPPITVIQQSFEGLGGRAIGAGAGSIIALTAAQIRAIADLSGYVPYTGASGAVNLGANALTCGAVTTNSTSLSVSPANNHAVYALVVGGRYAFQYYGGVYSGNQPLNINASGGLTLLSTDRVINWGNAMLWNGPSAGILSQRNSTNAQQFRINKTYTSSTNEEFLSLGYNATSGFYDIASKVGSAGGSNQPIRLGHYNTSSVFVGLSVATTGAVTASGTITGRASTTAAATAPIKLATGVLMTTPEAGAIEYDGTNFYFTNSGATRQTVATASGYVPYTGASGAVNLGANALTCGAVTTNSTSLSVSPANNHAVYALVVGGRYAFQYYGGVYSGNQPLNINASGGLTLLSTDRVINWGNAMLWNGPSAGILSQRNSTNAQQFRINKTYTSSTNEEFLSLGYNATSGYFDVASKVGSAGGSNQPIRLGHYNTSSVFVGLSVATSGAITASGVITTTAATTAKASLNIPSGTAPTTPTNGDIWSDGSNILVRLGGVTYTLTKT